MDLYKLSVIVPIYNEQDNIKPLHEKIVEVLQKVGSEFEIIMVNDGSIDNSESILTELANEDPHLTVINFKRNFGQTAAMMAGLDHCHGDIILPIDGDLQNDPADIPRLLEKIYEGFDVVSGWRKQRKDDVIKRVFVSRVANKLISFISGVHLHDYGCTLKAYRREVIKPLRLYGEMHRFIPIFASWQGARVTELEVNHFPRIHGKSKYGIERMLKVILDLFVIKFFTDYEAKPIYIFGGFSILCFFSAFLTGVIAVSLRLFYEVSFIQTPLPLLVTLLFVTGSISLLMGLLAEILVQMNYEALGRSIYAVKNVVSQKNEEKCAE